MKFKHLPLSEGIQEALEHMNFTDCTEVQERAIPEILNGKDLIACAQTGTGKTAAFILPTLEIISKDNRPGVKALIICPTRELAMQIDNEIMGLAYFVNLHSTPVYGGGDGDDWEVQKEALSSGADIIVATPGKLISHIHQGYVNFSNLTHLILDEADRMMDMGFREDIEFIVSKLPSKRQNLMFSATMDPKIRKLIKKILHNPVEISLAIAKPAENVMQIAYLCEDVNKNKLLVELLSNKKSLSKVIVFGSTRVKVGEILRNLKSQGFSVGAISSDFSQEDREKILLEYIAGNVQILVGTDVISRGIDIENIDLVVNYDVPPKAADYVHRIGRTARAKKSGIAITFVNSRDMKSFSEIEGLIGSEVRKLDIPKTIGVSPQWNPKSSHKFRKQKNGKRFNSSKSHKKGFKRR